MTCNICPRKCNIDRQNGSLGYCHAPYTFKVGRIAPHYWEEPCISGEKGSGAIFFAGCNMGCVYCQNEVLSHGNAGRIYSMEELTEEALKLEAMGCHSLNLITGSHYLHLLPDFIREVKNRGLKIPVVYNTSSYEEASELRKLRGLVDCYLPDLKYLDSEGALRYSKAKDYPEVAKKAIEEMYRQTGDIEFSEDGIIKKGLIVRHLVLPRRVKESKEVIEYLYNTYGSRIYMSIMSQYTPHGNLRDYPEINRKLSEEEYDEVVDFAISLGVEPP